MRKKSQFMSKAMNHLSDCSDGNKTKLVAYDDYNNLSFRINQFNSLISRT